MAVARTSRALKASKALFILLKSSTDWTGSLKNELFSFRGFTQLLITFFFFFGRFPPWKSRWWFYWQKPPRKTQVAPSPVDSLPAEIAAICHRERRTVKHAEENLPILQKLLTRCGLVGEHNNPQSRRLCQENSSFSNLWEGEKESKLLENIEGLDEPF